MEKKGKGLKALNPITALCIVLCLGIIATIFDYKVMLCMLIIMEIAAAVSGEGLTYIKLWLKSVFILCAICFLFQALFIPGETVLYKALIFTVTQESLDAAISLSTRLFGIGSAAILGVKLIDVKHLVTALESKGVPSSVGFVILSTLNIIPQMSKQMKSILEAQKSRGIEMESNLIVRAKAFFPSIGPLLLSSILGAEERAITMEARAFSANCRKTKLVEIPDTGRDKALRILAIIVCILVIVGRILWIVL